MKAHILIVADGRSPTALCWIGHLQALDYDVSLASTFPCDLPKGILHYSVFPVAFSQFSRPGTSVPDTGQAKSASSGFKKLVRRFAPLLQRIRYILGPWTLPFYRPNFRDFVKEVQPDLVHALRIPYEGMLASATPKKIPFLAATWGNDLTLHAKGSLWMRRQTRHCLTRANGLSSDTLRDVRLAKEWGLKRKAPTLVVPGTGGLNPELIRNSAAFNAETYDIPNNVPWVVNPRGLRPGSVHQDVFFEAIPKVLAQRPDTIFLCPSLEGVKQAESWIVHHEIGSQAVLLPKLNQTELWGIFKAAKAFVSPSSHDGTPNTLLEAMACGCFPIAGQIESLQEWIESGENGLLVDPQDPDALAAAILQALDSPALLKRAAELNRGIINARADQLVTRPLIDSFYQSFLDK